MSVLAVTTVVAVIFTVAEKVVERKNSAKAKRKRLRRRNSSPEIEERAIEDRAIMSRTTGIAEVENYYPDGTREVLRGGREGLTQETIYVRDDDNRWRRQSRVIDPEDSYHSNQSQQQAPTYSRRSSSYTNHPRLEYSSDRDESYRRRHRNG